MEVPMDSQSHNRQNPIVSTIMKIILGVVIIFVLIYFLGAKLQSIQVGPFAFEIPIQTVASSEISNSYTPVNSFPNFYDDFNNAIFDGSFDKTKWTLEEDSRGACNVAQQDGHLLIKHAPSSSASGCFISGPFEGIGGGSFK